MTPAPIASLFRPIRMIYPSLAGPVRAGTSVVDGAWRRAASSPALSIMRSVDLSSLAVGVEHEMLAGGVRRVGERIGDASEGIRSLEDLQPSVRLRGHNASSRAHGGLSGGLA